MKKNGFLIFKILISTIVLSAVLNGCSSSGSGDSVNGNLTVLSTNDRHSSFLSSPYDPGDPAISAGSTRGGLARISTLVADARTAEPDTLLLDAGDFIDGTIFITGENGAADFNIMKKIGYDAACIGNHELSMGPKGLAQMILNAQKESDGSMLPILSANLKFSSTSTADDDLEAIYGNEGEAGKYIFPYIIRTTASGIKVGIFGLIGEEVYMPDAAPVTAYIDYTEIQALVNKLRDEEKVHAVICVSHASFSVSGGVATGELADLAKNISGIDLVCAGHSHVEASASISCEVSGSDWETVIIEAGDNAGALGRVSLPVVESSVKHDGIISSIIPADDSVASDTSIIADVNSLITDIENNYLTAFSQLGSGGLFDVLAAVPFTMGRLNGMNLTADAMRWGAGSDVALLSWGADGANPQPNSDGNITVYDAFRGLPHAMGSDGLHGSANYTFYLYAEEVRQILELTTCNLGLGDVDLYILPSGIRLVYDTTDLRAGTGDGYILQMYYTSADEATETLVFDRTNSAWDVTGSWMSGPATTELREIPIS